MLEKSHQSVPILSLIRYSTSPQQFHLKGPSDQSCVFLNVLSEDSNLCLYLSCGCMSLPDHGLSIGKDEDFFLEIL